MSTCFFSSVFFFTNFRLGPSECRRELEAKHSSHAEFLDIPRRHDARWI